MLPAALDAGIIQRMRAWYVLLVLPGIAVGCVRPPKAAENPSPAPAATARDSAGVERYPQTVAEAVAMTLAKMSKAEKDELRAVPRKDLPQLLHGFQMTKRHEYGLSRDNLALLQSCGSQTTVLEECLLVILDAIWLALQGASAREVAARH